MDSEKITLKRGEFKFPFVDIESIDDVAKYVSKQTFYKAESQLMDWDKNYFTIQLRKQNGYFYFYVMDKLVYADDIKKYLCDKAYPLAYTASNTCFFNVF